MLAAVRAPTRMSTPVSSADDTLDLLRRWHGGDPDAVARLVDRDRGWVEARLRRRRAARGDGDTQDDCQDLMLRVLRYSPRFVCANRRQFRGLLARMIENLVIDRARGRRRREVHFESVSESRLDLTMGGVHATDPVDAAARGEDRAWLRLGLEFLAEADRDVVWQRHLEEATFAAIAAEVGSTEDAVRMRYQRALLRLAAIVQRLRGGDVDLLLREVDEPSSTPRGGADDGREP